MPFGEVGSFHPVDDVPFHPSAYLFILVQVNYAQAVVVLACESEVARGGYAELGAEPIVRSFVMRVVKRVER